MSFYFGNVEYAANKIMRTMFDLIYFPQSIFTGIIKIISMSIIPAFFIGMLPVQLIKEFNIYSFLLLITFVIIQTIIAFMLFNKGLKYYESGNYINIKN